MLGQGVSRHHGSSNQEQADQTALGGARQVDRDGVRTDDLERPQYPELHHRLLPSRVRTQRNPRSDSLTRSGNSGETTSRHDASTASIDAGWGLVEMVPQQSGGCSMVTRFGTYGRTLLAGLLIFWGAVAVSVVGGSLSSSPAAAASPPAWTAYVVSNATDAVIPVNTATDAVGTAITVRSGPSAIAITPDATTAYVTDEGTTNTAPGF